MAQQTNQNYVCPRITCPGGCFPGQCLNASCKLRLHDPTVLGRPDLEEEAERQKHNIEESKIEEQAHERREFLKKERKKMGMELFRKAEDISSGDRIPKADFSWLKSPDKVTKTMRDPVRPLCMLDPIPYTPPSDDYNDLSRFLRVSTMPGFSNNELVSEYHDNHNMAVWNNRKDMDPQTFKVKRDWLSVWGEFNVVEQRLKKAWGEKFGN